VSVAEQFERAARPTVYLSPAAVPPEVPREWLEPLGLGDALVLPGLMPEWEAVRRLLEERDT